MNKENLAQLKGTELTLALYNHFYYLAPTAE
jgi:hypothetical protein